MREPSVSLPPKGHHRGCSGRWRGAVSLGYGPDGKRIRRKVGGRTKQEVRDKLEALHADLTAGIAAPDGRYTVGQAIEDWLRDGLDGRALEPDGRGRAQRDRARDPARGS